MRRELVDDLESQGRYVDLSIYLERALEPELTGTGEATQTQPMRVQLLVELARIYRGPLDDESKAGRVYERLEQLGRLPDEGLATLARTYHRAGRHGDLVRILRVRAKALAEADEPLRKAAVDHRIAELLEGPLGRPHEAATHYLDAYLADPRNNTNAGARARVLLAGTDAVVNVRARLHERLDTVIKPSRPALLTLLGDVLGPHEDYEAEAETHYQEALRLEPHHGPAQEALGRLLARQGRLEEAVVPLVAAARNPNLAPARAADDAAVAARALLELERPEDAEAILKFALGRAPESQRALLELARLYERTDRAPEQAIVLESLSQLPVSSMLGAEVAFRRAMLLMPAAREDAYCQEAERARAYLLEAVSSDAKHVAARQALLELARARLEWSVVAHMHYLAIRELPPGPARARVHLDLAETYLAHLGDIESASRNLESAIQQAPEELVVITRAGQMAARLPDPRRVADRFERIASTSAELGDAARARLWLLAADLRMTDDDMAAAEAASQRVLDLEEAPERATVAAQRKLDTLTADDAMDLRRQKSGLLRLLDQESQPSERLHILGRLRELGEGLGDNELVEWASRKQLDLATTLGDDAPGLEGATTALTDVLADRGEYEQIVELHERRADAAEDDTRRARALATAAGVAWNGVRDVDRASRLLQRSIACDPGCEAAYTLMGELASHAEDDETRTRLYTALQQVPRDRRTPWLALQAGSLAAGLGRVTEALTILRPLAVQTADHSVRLRALRALDGVLAGMSSAADRLPNLRRLLEEAVEQASDDAAQVAYELARCELSVGDAPRALRVCEIGLECDADHVDLLRLRIRILERLERWESLALALEGAALAIPDAEARASGLVKAARIWLDHPGDDTGPRNRARAQSQARRLLMRACDAASRLAEARATLLPIEFAEARWDDVLRLSIELRELRGDDEDCLILSALTEAFVHGQRSLARDLGFRHPESAHERFLYPGLRQLLTEVAVRGPLPRLDSILAAAAALCGGRTHLGRALRRWAAGRPLQAGLALGMARLAEAEGHAELARCLYQVTAFMVPGGPVPPLVARLPLARPADELHSRIDGPLGAGSSLRRALIVARDALAGTVGPLPAAPDPGERPDADGTRLALADTMLEPLRRQLGLPLPLRWSDDDPPGGVGTLNTTPPAVIVGSEVRALSVADLRFRLAMAATTIAMGLSILESSDISLADLLDGLTRMASAGHEPAGLRARVVSEAIAAAGLHRRLQPTERVALIAELRHWLGGPHELDPLRVELSRNRLWFATRISGQLDGALSHLAYELGFVRSDGVADPVATLRTEEAQWLLRGLELYTPG
jgi:tetratricopeptide (TPR) repeat protein